jgi:hypothetical protein
MQKFVKEVKILFLFPGTSSELTEEEKDAIRKIIMSKNVKASECEFVFDRQDNRSIDALIQDIRPKVVISFNSEKTHDDKRDDEKNDFSFTTNGSMVIVLYSIMFFINTTKERVRLWSKIKPIVF